MSGLGSGDNGELTFIDWIALISFWVALQNLDLNLTQEDKQDLENYLTEKSKQLLNEIHGHLTAQDEKLNEILELLERRDSNGANQTY